MDENKSIPNDGTEPTEAELQALVAQHEKDAVDKVAGAGQDGPGEAQQPDPEPVQGKGPETPLAAPEPESVTDTRPDPLPEPDAPMHLPDLFHGAINKIRSVIHAEEIRLRDDLIADIKSITLHEDDHPLVVKYKADVLAYLRSFN